MSRAPTPVAEATRRVACTYCGSKAGEACVTASGRPAVSEHADRFWLATDAGYLPLRSGSA